MSGSLLVFFHLCLVSILFPSFFGSIPSVLINNTHNRWSSFNICYSTVVLLLLLPCSSIIMVQSLQLSGIRLDCMVQLILQYLLLLVLMIRSGKICYHCITLIGTVVHWYWEYWCKHVSSLFGLNEICTVLNHFRRKVQLCTSFSVHCCKGFASITSLDVTILDVTCSRRGWWWAGFNLPRVTKSGIGNQWERMLAPYCHKLNLEFYLSYMCSCVRLKFDCVFSTRLFPTRSFPALKRSSLVQNSFFPPCQYCSSAAQ